MAGKLEKREYFGDTLRQKFGGPDQQDQQIDGFIIMFGSQIAHDPRWSKGLDLDALIGEGGQWDTLEDEDSFWPGVFSQDIAKEGHESYLERDQLKKLTTKVKDKFESLGFNQSSVYIMLHRACMYGNPDNQTEPLVEPAVTEDQIRVIVDQESHFNLFYITVQKDNTDKVLDILTALEVLPGDWRKVEPQETWPDTFLGYFPKKYLFETERMREERLNREVRVPLKQNLEQQADTNRKDPSKPSKVHILLTRACKY